MSRRMRIVAKPMRQRNGHLFPIMRVFSLYMSMAVSIWTRMSKSFALLIPCWSVKPLWGLKITSPFQLVHLVGRREIVL